VNPDLEMSRVTLTFDVWIHGTAYRLNGDNNYTRFTIINQCISRLKRGHELVKSDLYVSC